jgi:hypothetical protein
MKVLQQFFFVPSHHRYCLSCPWHSRPGKFHCRSTS